MTKNLLDELADQLRLDRDLVNAMTITQTWERKFSLRLDRDLVNAMTQRFAA